MKHLTWTLLLAGVLACTPTPAPTDIPSPVAPVIVSDVPTATPPVDLPRGAEGLHSDETPLEKAILDRALKCEGAKAPRKFLLDILRQEEVIGVPLRLRGFSLAAACIESRFDPNAEGDHKFSKDGKTPVAIGLYQQWPWWSKSPTGPKINRRNPQQATKSWLAHVARQVPSMQRKCGFNSVKHQDALWKAAWVTAVRAPAKKPWCRSQFSHWDLFREWRGSWETQIQASQVTSRI